MVFLEILSGRCDIFCCIQIVLVRNVVLIFSLNWTLWGLRIPYPLLPFERRTLCILVEPSRLNLSAATLIRPSSLNNACVIDLISYFLYLICLRISSIMVFASMVRLSLFGNTEEIRWIRSDFRVWLILSFGTWTETNPSRIIKNLSPRVPKARR